MTHNVHPYAFRLGILRDWKSRWFNRSAYAQFLREDTLLREWLVRKLKDFMIESIEIERSAREFRLTIHTPRPGLLIGRGGEGIEKLKREILLEAGKISPSLISPNYAIKLNVEEVRSPESNAKVVACLVVQDFEKRLPFRRILKQHVAKVISNRDVEGVRILVKGRLDGSEMSRREWRKEGKIPLQTLRANVDYAQETAILPYGSIGVKVWIYKGQVFSKTVNEQSERK